MQTDLQAEDRLTSAGVVTHLMVAQLRSACAASHEPWRCLSSFALPAQHIQLLRRRRERRIRRRRRRQALARQQVRLLVAEPVVLESHLPEFAVHPSPWTGCCHSHVLRTCLMQCGCTGRNEQDPHRRLVSVSKSPNT